MAKAHLFIGAAQGLEQARRRMRDEHFEEEDRAIRDEDRAEDKKELEYLRSRRGVEDVREDEDYAEHSGNRALRTRGLTTQVEGAETSLDAARTNLQYAKEDRSADVQMRDLGVRSANADFGDARTSAARESELHGIKIKQIQKELEEEGMGRLLDALETGADPEYAVNLFNAQGKNGIKPGTLRYDKQTDQLSFTGTGGQQFNGTSAQLRSLMLPKTSGNKPLVVPNTSSLYDTKTGKWTQPPAAAGGAAGTRNGQKLSTFNPQTHQKRAQDLVMQRLGGEWDNATQRFKIPAGMGEKVGFGVSLSDSLVREFEDEGLPVGPGEVADIVGNALRGVKTTGEAMKTARATLGDNAGDDAIANEADRIIDDSKIAASLALKQDKESLRARLQQQQASQQYPAAPGVSPDMEGGEGAEAPPVELLREGYVQQFQDGSSWTLENGRPVQVQQ